MLCIFGIGILEILDIIPHFLWCVYRDENGALKVQYYVLDALMTSGYTMFHLLSLSICVLAASCGYCLDMESGIINEVLQRSSYRKYTIASMLSCAVSAFLCTVFGEIIMIIFYRCFGPVHGMEGLYENSYPLLQSGHYYLYIVAVLVQRGLKGAFFAMVSFMLSGFVKNKFVIISVPVLVFYLLQRFGYGNFDPSFDIFNVHAVYSFFLFKTEGQSLLYVLSYTITAGIILGIIFYKRLRRKY